MGICVQVKRVLEILGYLPIKICISSKYEKYLKFLRKLPIQMIQNGIIFSAHILYCVQPIAFFFLEAKDTIDYQESLFFSNHSLICLISYALFVQQKQQIVHRMADFEALIEQSKQTKI